MTEVYLAVIALAVVVIAGVQVGVAVFAMRAASRINRLATSLERDIRPVLASLQAVGTDTAHLTALAAAQLERVDRVFEDFIKKTDRFFGTLQSTLRDPLREGATILNAFKTIFEAFRELRETTRKRRASADEEDALFIG